MKIALHSTGYYTRQLYWRLAWLGLGLVIGYVTGAWQP